MYKQDNCVFSINNGLPICINARSTGQQKINYKIPKAMQWYMYKNIYAHVRIANEVGPFLSSTIDKAIKSISSRRVWVIVIHSPPSGDRVITTSAPSSSTILVTRMIATPWAALTMVAVGTVTVTWIEKRGEEGKREDWGKGEGGREGGEREREREM